MQKHHKTPAEEQRDKLIEKLKIPEAAWRFDFAQKMVPEIKHLFITQTSATEDKNFSASSTLSLSSFSSFPFTRQKELFLILEKALEKRFKTPLQFPSDSFRVVPQKILSSYLQPLKEQNHVREDINNYITNEGKSFFANQEKSFLALAKRYDTAAGKLFDVTGPSFPVSYWVALMSTFSLFEVPALEHVAEKAEPFLRAKEQPKMALQMLLVKE